MFSSNKWNKKEGSPSSFWRKRHLISFNSSVFIENLPSFERARARARANHAKIDAQKGCAMQLNGITLRCLNTVCARSTICTADGQGGKTADWLFISRVLALSTDQSKAAQVN